jgi:hypothetical protein
MIILRGHYFIDLFAGVVFAHYFWILAEKYCYFIDEYYLKISFKERFPFYSDKCENCNKKIKNDKHQI